MNNRVAIGVPYFGPQEASWWSNLVNMVGSLHAQGIDYTGLILSGAMATDHNRNAIVADFLVTDADWLFWIDADTMVPNGCLPRMLALGKTMVSGLYYGKGGEHPPIAYFRRPDGAYQPMDVLTGWERGEILPVDACGMGCMLTHRSVFEDIMNAYIVYQRAGGGLTCIHREDIKGEVKASTRSPNDGKVRKGQLFERLIPPTVEVIKFPFFALEFGRTEDMWFFELARRVGHKPWLDTSLECGHLHPHAFTGEDYRKYKGLVP